MKHVLFILAMLFVATFQLAASNDAPSISIYSADRSIVLSKTGILADANSMTISNADGEVIFTHNLKSDKHRIKYDLGKLPNGTYNLEIDGTDHTEAYQVVMTDSNITLQEVETFHSPILSIDESNKVMINLESDNPESISYFIYDNAGKLVYDYSEVNTGTLNKVFNLEQLQPGKYKIYTSTAHFSQNIWVNL